jgi:hypothetical protein
MNWKRFPGRPNSNKAKPSDVRITMNHNSVMFINTKAHETLGSPDTVELIYEDEKRVIGVLAGDPEAANTFPVSYNPKSKVRCIYAAAFCRHFDINIDRTILFTTAALDEDNVLRLDLEQTVAVGRGAREE